MKLIFNDEEIKCTKAIKGTDFIQVFREEYVIAEFGGISNFDGYELQDDNGNLVEYELPQATEIERIKATEEAINMLITMSMM